MSDVESLLCWLLQMISVAGCCEWSVSYNRDKTLISNKPAIITVIKQSKWRSYERIEIQIGGEKVVGVLPSQKMVGFAMRDVHIIIGTWNLITFNLKLKPLSDDERWLQIFDRGSNECSRIFINSDQAPTSYLYWRTHKSLYFQGYRSEGNIIDIICHRLHGSDSTPILLNVPENISLANKIITNDQIIQSFKLTKFDGEKTVSCTVDKMTSFLEGAFDVDYNYEMPVDMDKSLNSVIIGVIAAVLSLFFILLGIYLVILKQRQMYNNQRTKKMAKVAQGQIQLLSKTQIRNKHEKTIFELTGHTHSKNFSGRIDKFRMEKMGINHIESKMSEIEHLHELAKMESTLRDSSDSKY